MANQSSQEINQKSRTLHTPCSVDLSGGRLVGRGLVDDGATPPRRIYPYNS